MTEEEMADARQRAKETAWARIREAHRSGKIRDLTLEEELDKRLSELLMVAAERAEKRKSKAGHVGTASGDWEKVRSLEYELGEMRARYDRLVLRSQLALRSVRKILELEDQVGEGAPVGNDAKRWKAWAMVLEAALDKDFGRDRRKDPLDNSAWYKAFEQLSALCLKAGLEVHWGPKAEVVLDVSKLDSLNAVVEGQQAELIRLRGELEKAGVYAERLCAEKGTLRELTDLLRTELDKAREAIPELSAVNERIRRAALAAAAECIGIVFGHLTGVVECSAELLFGAISRDIRIRFGLEGK